MTQAESTQGGGQSPEWLCSYCDKRIFGEPSVADPMERGRRMHIWCAAEDLDETFFDRDMGDS